MVERFKKILQTPLTNLHEAAFVLGLSALASQVLAIVRDRIFAHIFGAGSALDIYYAAFKVPDLLFVTVASLVSMTVLIPYFTRELLIDKDGARDFLDSVFTIFITLLSVFAILAFLLMPELSFLIAPGFSPEARLELIKLSRILLLSPFFLGLSSHIAGIIHSFRKFIVYALSPVFYNVGIILGILFLYPHFGLEGLAWGVVLGAFLHFAIQWPTVRALGFAPCLRVSILWPKVREVFLVSVPRTFTLGVHQMVTLIFTALASMFATGSIAVFNFSFNLQSVPLAIIGMSYSMAAFPTLATLFSNGERDKFATQIGLAARNIVFWSMPVTALFIVLRAQIVRTILGSGAFNWTNTRLTAAALAIFAISVVGQGLVLLFVRGYYASGNTKVPLVANTLSGLAMVGFSFVLTYMFNHVGLFRYFFEALFRVQDLPGTQILMLPLAYSLGVLCNALVYVILFARSFPEEGRRLFNTTTQSFYGAVLMGFVSYEALTIFDNLLNLNTLSGIFMQGFFSGIIGIVTGVLLLRLLGNEEFSDFKAAAHRRFWRAKPILPGPEEINQV